MKSQIKRFSKSTLSVILVFCMLVSCVTAGIIATGAAKDDSENVGAISSHFYLIGNLTGNNWNSNQTNYKIDTSYGSDGKFYIEVNGVQDAWFALWNGSNRYAPSSSCEASSSNPNAASGDYDHSGNSWQYKGTASKIKICIDETVGTRDDKEWYPAVWVEEVASTPLSAPTLEYNSSTTSPVNITGSSASLTWADVSNASSYTVYKDGTAVQTNATSPYSATSTGSYTVKAIGNGTTYSDSDASNAIQLNFQKTTTIYVKSGLKNKNNGGPLTNAYIWSNDSDKWTGNWPGEAITGWTASGDYYYKSFTNAYSKFKVILQGNSAQTSDSEAYDTGKTYRIDSVNTEGDNGKAVLTEGAPADPACTSVSLSQSPSSGTIYTGETLVTYTASVTGAQSGVTYNFKVDGTSVQNTSSNTYTTTFASAGTKSVTVTVEKSGYGSVISSVVSTTVINRPSVYFKYDQTGGTTTKGLSGTAMTYDSTLGLYKLSVNLNKGSSGNWYYIVIYDSGDGANLSYNNGTLTETLRTATGYTVYSGDNNVDHPLHIVASVTGTYNFYYNESSNKLFVECPHTVTFDANGHGTAPSSQVVNYGGKATTPTAPTASGWTFGGWYKESGCTNAWDFSTETVTTDKTLYAKWTQDSYAITYPNPSNYTITNKSHASSAHYGETVSFTVTASSGYRITGVTYTPTGGSAQNCTAGSNNTYSFTMPAANVTISVSTVQTYTVTLTAGEGFDSRQYKLGSSGTYQSYTSGTTLTVDKNTDVYFSVTYSTGYQYSSKTNLTVVTANTVFKTGAVSANVTATLTASKIPYNLTGSVSPAHGTVTFYSNSGCTTQITTATYQQTVYAKYTPADGYVLKNFTYSGTGITNTSTSGNVFTFKMGYAAATITANVMLQYSVNYYVDMHDNSMSGKTVEVAIVTNGGGTTVAKDSNGNDCKATLARQGNSTVYMASINTPVTQTSGSYNGIYVRVTYTGKTPVTIYVEGTNVATLASTHEMWLEAVNESSQTLSINYSTTFNPETGSTPAVATGYRRIYLAKPYGWQDNETKWKNIKVYHWGNYNDMGWNNGISMSYLGYGKMPGADSESTDVYHYYYADLPKYLVNSGNSTALSDATNGNKVQNIIFQGWADGATSPSVQTGNIEEIPDSADFFILSKDGSAYVGTRSDEDVIIPTFARHATRVEMNVGQTGVNIAPVKTGANVTYESSNPAKVSVSSTGEITASASTVGETNNEVTITVKVYGSIGDKIRDTANGGGNPNNGADAVIYTVTVSAHNPSNFNGFEIMSLESQTYTVKVPQIDSSGNPVDSGGTQPGYFDMSNVVMTVEGIKGVTSSTNSAIITQTGTTSVSGVGTVCTAFTVKYAKANSLFENYGNISVIGKVTTKSIRRDGGDRYGHDHWEEDGTTKTYTTSRVIDNGIETATTEGIPFDDTKATYSDIFAAYQYVDVTFTFNYDEYKPKKVDADGNVVADDDDGMIQYPYDASWANNEDSSNAQLYGRSHTTKTFVVQNYEVRYSPEKGETFAGNLKNTATVALGIGPSNNYYDYELPDTVSATTPSNYKATSTVNLIQSVKQYKVYLNGELKPRSNPNDPNDNRTYYYYQEYAEPSVENPANWYAVDDRNSTDTTNAPLLATGVNSYKFRVKGSAKSTNTYLRTEAATNPHGNDFLRSEVDFSHYEVTHQGSSPTSMKEYLMQNFYIADFFSPAKVLDPASNNGQGNLPYDDAQFVGGGVVYYSMNGATENNQGTPFANAVSSGYVGNDGKINEAAIKNMLKANIEAQYAKDNIAGAVGENEAMKIAYGTEIAATKNKEGGFNTGIIYRYLPLNQYKRDGNGTLLAPDQDGNYAYDVNTNTFRYSNSLQSYQYVYASGNENKETNTGKNMRLYSYFVYSYTAYNQETNVPETRYEIVISDNYSDASTYWDGQN